MDGLLLINKPKGWTSFDVVARVRGLVRQETGKKKPKVGHTGTLDPLATGLLILVIGSYCKRAQEFSKLDKTYQISMRLGQTSTTGDEEGIKTHISDKRPSEEAVKAAAMLFVGEIEQTPPIYSAVKVNGQRAYKLARAGQAVKLEPRKVTVYSIDGLSYNYPEIKFTAKVSSGTYIRSLVEDIGQELSTGAFMTDLHRSQVGRFMADDALTGDGLTGDKVAAGLFQS